MIPTFTTPAHILDESLMRLLFHINNPEFDISLHSDPLDLSYFTHIAERAHISTFSSTIAIFDILLADELNYLTMTIRYSAAIPAYNTLPARPASLDYCDFTADTYTTCFYDDNSPDPLTFT
jgi:hypothetical protein